MTLTVKDALAQAAMLDTETSRLDTEILLSHSMDRSRTWLYTWPDITLDSDQEQRFVAFMQRRQAGEPVAYITGRRAFWNFELNVSADVLIPRPETELLVDLALRHLKEFALDRAVCIADLGTGSGAIALAIASERPDCRVFAIDQSAQALAVARINARELGQHNVEFRQGSWCEPLEFGSVDMIVSNPPYVAKDDPHLQLGDLRFEPARALVSDGGGLADISAICSQARRYLRQGGMLLLEHGYRQAPDVRSILQRAGYSHIGSRRDLAGHERVTFGMSEPDVPPAQ